MYRCEKNIPHLFGRLFHLGDRLDEKNRWLRLGDAIDWRAIDNKYGEYFSDGYGRPAKDSCLVGGLLIVKQLKNLSDEETIAEFIENPYIQAFCGQEYFTIESVVSPWILSERRARLGRDFLQMLEEKLKEALRSVGKEVKIRPVKSLQNSCLFCALIDKIKKIFQ